jgi:hypothetical protein
MILCLPQCVNGVNNFFISQVTTAVHVNCDRTVKLVCPNDFLVKSHITPEISLSLSMEVGAISPPSFQWVAQTFAWGRRCLDTTICHLQKKSVGRENSQQRWIDRLQYVAPALVIGFIKVMSALCSICKKEKGPSKGTLGDWQLPVYTINSSSSSASTPVISYLSNYSTDGTYLCCPWDFFLGR